MTLFPDFEPVMPADRQLMESVPRLAEKLNMDWKSIFFEPITPPPGEEEMTTPITTQDDEQKTKLLKSLTSVARKGLIHYHAAGKALAQIRDSELWRMTGIETFDGWCVETFQMGYGRINKIIDTSRTLDHLIEAGFKNLPAGPEVTRQLVGLKAEDAVAVWSEAVATEEKPTAKLVGSIARRRKTSLVRPLSMKIPGACLRIIPRKRGFVSFRRVLEQALQLIIEQEQRKEVA